MTKSLLYGLYLAGVDAIVLVLLKMKYLGYIKTPFILLFAAIVYAIQPLVFYSSFFSGISLTMMNLIWDLLSDIIISFIGIFIFGESLLTRQKFGLLLGTIALILMK